MTIAAISAHDGRIAPVLDAARRLLLLRVEDGHVLAEAEEALPSEPLEQKAARLAELRIDSLICGAVSRPLQNLLEECGITVIPFLAGTVEEIVNAWLTGTLSDERYAMPGCRGGARRRGRFRGGGGAGPHGGGCQCPTCGYTEPHEPGIPCVTKQCPQCHTSLKREP